MPKRIQMTRQRPWRADSPEAVIVARPSEWGNPFKVGEQYVCLDDGTGPGVLDIPHRAAAAGAFRGWLTGEFSVREFDKARVRILDHIQALHGLDLACWCPLGLDEDGYYQCHADVLLELANSDEGAEHCAGCGEREAEKDERQVDPGVLQGRPDVPRASNLGVLVGHGLAAVPALGGKSRSALSLGTESDVDADDAHDGRSRTSEGQDDHESFHASERTGTGPVTSPSEVRP